MTAPDPRSQSLIELFSRLRAGWPVDSWEWDGRFACALSTVGGADEAKARQALLAGLPAAWTAQKLPDAPALLRKICAGTGGLRGGQMIFSADLPDGTCAYCLWWPWGSGSNFSARVGAAAADGTDLTFAVRAGFGLA
jgi:hypothetical protein